MILVDPVRAYTKVSGYRGRPTSWCHCVSTVDEAELHAFAERVGMKRAWAQLRPEASSAHYDLTASKRLVAVRLGAVEVTGKQLAMLNYDGLRRRGLIEAAPYYEAELAKLAHLLEPQP